MSNTLGTNYTYYKVKHSVDDKKDCFVGSAENIKRRIYEHKHAIGHSKLYKYVRKNGGWDNWKFEIIEKKLCETPYQRYMHESELIKQNNATLHTYGKGMRAVNYDDDRKQYCGRCGMMLYIQDTCISKLQKHHATLKCKNAPPPVIVKGSNNTINISYMKGKKPILIEGVNNTINIHY